jgi:hypothetical protein
LSFVLVRLLDLRDILHWALFLWRNNCTSSLSNLFLVCLHHIYPLCALWQCVHYRDRDSIVWKRYCVRLVLWLRTLEWLHTDVELNYTELSWAELHWISDLLQFSSWERQFVVFRAAPIVGGGGGGVVFGAATSQIKILTKNSLDTKVLIF